MRAKTGNIFNDVDNIYEKVKELENSGGGGGIPYHLFEEVPTGSTITIPYNERIFGWIVAGNFNTNAVGLWILKRGNPNPIGSSMTGMTVSKSGNNITVTNNSGTSVRLMIQGLNFKIPDKIDN